MIALNRKTALDAAHIHQFRVAQTSCFSSSAAFLVGTWEEPRTCKGRNSDSASTFRDAPCPARSEDRPGSERICACRGRGQRRGLSISVGGQLAEMILTVEMLQTWHGDSLCRLPGGPRHQRQCLRHPASLRCRLTNAGSSMGLCTGLPTPRRTLHAVIPSGARNLALIFPSVWSSRGSRWGGPDIAFCVCATRQPGDLRQPSLGIRESRSGLGGVKRESQGRS